MRRLGRTLLVFVLAFWVSLGIFGVLMAADRVHPLLQAVLTLLAFAVPVAAAIIAWRSQGPRPRHASASLPVAADPRPAEAGRAGSGTEPPRAAASRRLASAVHHGLRRGGDAAGRIHAGDAGTDGWLMAVLLLAGAGVCVLGVALQAMAVLFSGAMLVGLAAAIGYDRPLGRVLRLAALPRPREALLTLVCAVTILVAAIALAVALLAPLPVTRSPTAATLARVQRALSVLAPLLLAAPLLLRIVRPYPVPAADRPVWPPLAALLGGGLAWGGGALAWGILGLSDAAPFRDMQRLALTAPLAAILLWLPIGVGARAWYQALVAGEAEGFAWRPLIPASLAAAAGLVALTLGLCGVALATWTGALHGARFGIALGLGGITVTCAAWLVTLWRLRALRPRSLPRAVLCWALLAVLFPVSVGLAGLPAGADVFAELVAVVSVPVVIAACTFILLGAPRLLRRAARGAAPG